MVKKKEKVGEKIRPMYEQYMKGEGISDVEDRRSKFAEKHEIKHYVDEDKKKEIQANLCKGIEFKLDLKDYLIFFLSNFLPLFIIASACFVPGIVLLVLNGDLFTLILIINGGLFYLFLLTRTVAAFTYKIKMDKDTLQWRNIFWWNDVPNKDIIGIKAIHGYYMYFTKIGGVARIGVEAIKITSTEGDYWIRAFSFKKSKSDDLVIAIKCWIELNPDNTFE
ncbi:MAG: hypothetical protein ACTSO7_03930 [Candidatus Heimdallarchaeota archaeon]